MEKYKLNLTDRNGYFYGEQEELEGTKVECLQDYYNYLTGCNGYLATTEYNCLINEAGRKVYIQIEEVY